MAKTRAQRKAEKRRREQLAKRQGGDGIAKERDEESQAQRHTQAPISGDVAEAEAVIETGARTEDYGEHTQSPDLTATQAPAPSRADVGVPSTTDLQAPTEEPRESRRDRRRREKEERREQKARELKKAQAQKPQGEKPEKRRGRVLGFIASCWAELKKVQWPDRDTLVQASAVTLIFVVVMAAYLGGLDAIFNWLVKQIL